MLTPGWKQTTAAEETSGRRSKDSRIVLTHVSID